jgi:hypothetical protein
MHTITVKSAMDISYTSHMHKIEVAQELDIPKLVFYQV